MAERSAPVRPSARERLLRVCTAHMLAGTLAEAGRGAVERDAGVPAGSLDRHFGSIEGLVDAALATLRERSLRGAGPAERPANVGPRGRGSDTEARPGPQAGRSRRDRTRNALIDAGKRLIRHGHIDNASIDEIVQAAGVGKGSFFNHFPTREAFVRAILERVRAELETEIVAICDSIDDPVVRLARGLLASFRYRLDHGLGMRAIVAPAPGAADAEDPANALLRADLQAGIEAGTVRLPGVGIGVALVLGLSELGLARLLDLANDPVEQLALMQALCLTMLAGLGVDAGRHRAVTEDALRANARDG